jgi:hypothetical protein
MAGRRLTPPVLLRPLRQRHGLPVRYHNIFSPFPGVLSSSIHCLHPS